jgi:hypothetical protein
MSTNQKEEEFTTENTESTEDEKTKKLVGN